MTHILRALSDMPYMIILALTTSLCVAAPVADFGAVADDGKDDTKAIMAAIAASANVEFAAGVYDLITPLQPSAFIVVTNRSGLSLNGASNAAGPLTRLRRHVILTNDPRPPAIIDALNAHAMTVRSITFDSTPAHCTAGTVRSVSATAVDVAVYAGLPVFDGMQSYCINTWDVRTRDLKAIPSISFGKSIGSWRTTGEPNIVRLTGTNLSDVLSAGDGISWHVSVSGPALLSFYGCDDLHIENVRISTANSIPIIIGQCSNTTIRGAVFRAEGAHYAVGPRDGIHISKPIGELLIEHCSFEGMRWDGLNIKSMYFVVRSVSMDTRAIIVEQSPTMYPLPIHPGNAVFYRGGNKIRSHRIAASVYRGKENGMPRHELSLSSLPEGITPGMTMSCDSYNASSVIIRDSFFRNIAGSAIVLQEPTASIERCVFTNIMYASVHIGCTPMEGIPPDDVRVTGSLFDHCGWATYIGKTGIRGMIAIENHNKQLPSRCGNVFISNNIFRNNHGPVNDCAVYIDDADVVAVRDNRYERVTTPIVRVRPETVVLEE